MKRVLSFLLTSIIILSSLPLSAISANASPFSGGDGSEANPYLVATPEALDAVRKNPSAHYRQIADIDMSAWGDWEGTDLYGSYNGNGFTIKNLKITHNDKNRKSTRFGLFESVFHATVKNVNLINIDYSINTIVGNYAFYGMAIGGIAAWADSADIENCSVSGKINIQEGYFYEIGGILGHSHGNVTVKNCTNAASINTVTGHSEEKCETIVACGGIAGQIEGGDVIEHCTNIGNLNITSNNNAYVGGIIGNTLYSANITNCLNSGNILVNLPLNGLVEPPYYPFECITGGILGKGKSTISTCINYGSIDAITYNPEVSAVICGGISGSDSKYSNDSTIINCINAGAHLNIASKDSGELHNLSKISRISPLASTIENCYSYDKTTVNGKICQDTGLTKPNGNNITKGDLLLTSSYPAFDFSNTWIIDTKVGGAILRDIPYTPVPVEPDSPVPIEPDTPQEIIAEFNDLIYRADHLTSGRMNILSDNVTYSYLLTNRYSPSKIIVDAHPENMQTVAAAWEALKATVDAADGKASQVLKQSTKQEDLITAYILGAVGTYTDYQFADAVKNNFKHTKNLVNVLCELNGTYAAAGDEFKAFIKGKDGDLENLLREYYDKNDPTMSALLKTKKGISVVGSVISTASSIEDVVSEISSYSKLYGINESTKEALLLMYEICPEESVELKRALKLTAEIVSSANEEMISDIAEREFAFGLCKEASYAITDKLWDYMTDAFVDSCPVAKGYVALAKMELTVMDKFFGIDARTEQYFKLCTLNEVDSVAGLAVHQALNNYKESPTAENAATFLAAIDLKFGFVDQSYSESVKYSDVITDSGILQKMENGFRELFGIENVNKLKESLISAEKAKDALHCTVLTSWISALDAEDHSLAENYYEYRETIYTRYQPELANDFIEVFRNAAKQYSIHCPVNVKIYTSAGELVAEVGKDSLSASDDIAVIYDHGEKEIIFFDRSDYIIVCEGYEDGDMDIEVKEFDSDGNLIRTTGFNNVPVSSSSTHTLSGSSLEDGEGNSIGSDFDSTEASEKHKVTAENGVISGYLFETEASAGERVEISALVPEGYRFVGWQGDAEFEDARSASTYFFMKDGDVTVSAKLKRIDNEDEDDEDTGRDGTPLIVIFVIAGGALIAIAGIAILIVMIKERKKHSKKE